MVSACAAETPQWLGFPQAANSPDRADKVVLAKEFPLAGPVAAARLRLAADFCRATLTINGRRVVRLEAYSPTVDCDISGFVRVGPNICTIDLDRPCGPAAVAASLSIEQGEGQTTWIGTDSKWSGHAASGQALETVVLGPVAPELWGVDRRPPTIDAFDNYEQWRQATTSAAVENPADFWLAPGFTLTLLRTAEADEGSWVSLAFDPRGRLTIAREDQGLMRMTLAPDRRSVAEVETINSDLLECRGLLYAHGALYASANNSKGLYRLRDTNADDHFDEVKCLREFPGGVGHGRNDLALGPDGWIYWIHGDAVDVPTEGILDRTSPFREARRGQKTSEGFLLRTDADGKTWELLCGGLRNPYGIAFNPAGDAFTYDADAEFDMGTPWYRPTRVVQLFSGADFFWRGVTGAWPPYFPDQPEAAPPSFDIGKGSPTAVAFGTGSKFPPPYQQALFILDWAYGRVLAVHQAPRGAGYRSSAETFLKGRPMNVTDLAFGPDGALYLTTGGRKTQSALYRVEYVASPITNLEPVLHESACREHAAAARKLRVALEAFHGPPQAAALDAAWPHLDSDDPALRHAARVAIECQPVDTWRSRALAEDRPTALLEACLALARSESTDHGQIADRLLALDISSLTESQAFALVRLYSLCRDRLPTAARTSAAQQLLPLFAAREDSATYFGPALAGRHLQHALAGLLVRLNAPGIVDRVAGALLSSDRQEDRLQALFVLRNVKEGWTPESRRAYFEALNEAASFVGGDGMPRFIASLRDEATATLSAEEKASLSDVLMPPAASEPELVLPRRPAVKAWTIADFREALAAQESGGNAQRGATVFREALCVHCHRVGARGPAVGPDLTHVSSRFSKRDILESILTPSQVVAENYRNVQVLTTDGRVLIGRVLNEGDYRSETLKLAVDPLRPGKIELLSKRDIEQSKLTLTSPMPAGLLDTFSQSEILDLLAFLEGGVGAATGGK